MLEFNIDKETVEYDAELGQKCMEDYKWIREETDGVGKERINNGEES